MPSSILSFSFYSLLGTLSSDSIAYAGITGLQLKNTALIVGFFAFYFVLSPTGIVR